MPTSWPSSETWSTTPSTCDQAAVIGAVLARHVRTLDLTLDEWRVMLVESGAGSGFVDMVVDGAAFVRDGLNATVTDDVERAIGRPAGSFRLWVADHREAFG